MLLNMRVQDRNFTALQLRNTQSATLRFLHDVKYIPDFERFEIPGSGGQLTLLHARVSLKLSGFS